MALFSLSNEALATIEFHVTKNQPSARRVDDRRVISGILQNLREALSAASAATKRIATDSSYVNA